MGDGARQVAVEEHEPVTTEEFHVLNRCLDTAIAGAVTEHARITAASRSTGEIERSGQLAHEIRDLLNTALLAFHTLKRGTVIPSIRLTGDAQEIDCRYPGIKGLVLRAEFVRKR